MATTDTNPLDRKESWEIGEKLALLFHRSQDVVYHFRRRSCVLAPYRVTCKREPLDRD